ncbi:MAG: hypothetical protein IT384_14820 [Deltaproteobacteria bacterium]|nr:hypothetical protein [Deltaproteobacteria bacterium]
MKKTTLTARRGAPVYTLVLAAIASPAMAACGGDPFIPQVEAFSPASGTVGTEIAIRGWHFDRDGRGYPLEGAPLPWRVYLAGADRRWELVLADATERALRVTVPEGAGSGRIVIADPEGIISESAVPFEVLAHPIVRLFNDAQYDVVDLRMNGAQVLVDGQVLESGVSADVFATTGRYRIEYGLGEPKAPWVRGALHGIDVGAPGSETPARIPRLELIDLLTNHRATTEWVAVLRDAEGHETTFTVRIYGDGAWAFFEGTTARLEGQLVPLELAPYASSITFRLTEGGEPARMAPPFASFDLRIGSSSAPLLRYVRAPP